MGLVQEHWKMEIMTLLSEVVGQTQDHICVQG